ncbi:NADH:ubiquinone oxidoreductase [Tropilaelaps mercedesae]|uniref:NADH:ubiquinone oxidoreductase n=1 Tax=Tropilaelaps mercedesae TaxID=418985 RepID=A0A1V9XBI1_9ACAR|nr:NADH:ubiquinone oxidoreductase [Tropilaelaps mercedesae]
MADSGEMAPFYKQIFDGWDSPEKNDVGLTFLFTGLPAGAAFMAMCTRNYFLNRPYLSGIQRHILAVVGLGFAGNQLRLWLNRRAQYREAVLRHYVSLHPEDFPEPERKKISELFLDWDVRR